MFFQIGIECFGVGVDVNVDVGVSVGLSVGVGVGLGMGVGVGVGVSVGMGMGVGMLLLLLLLLHCCCCCCAGNAAEKLCNTIYLGLGERSAAVEYVACAHALSTEHTQAMVWASAQELTLLLTLLPSQSLA
jgi:hypothetical protein